MSYSNDQSNPAAALPVWSALGKPKGYAQITDLSAAVGLADIPDGATRALIRCDTQAVRWTDDGETTPTAAIGMPMLVADAPLLYGGDLTKLKFIQVTASAKLNVSYY